MNGDLCCEIVEHQDAGEVIACTLRMEGGQLQMNAAHGYENMLQNVIQMDVVDPETGAPVTMGEDAARWLELLPQKFRGSTYIEARLVE